MTNYLKMAVDSMVDDEVEGPRVILGPTALKNFATLVRNAALEEAAQQTGEFAQAWWSKHCASNKHMETTRAAHDDFCSLQIKIRNIKEAE